MSKLGYLASAFLAGVSGLAAAQADDARPITMRVFEQGGMVAIEVWASSRQPLEARYVLETVSGGSRSTQRGVAMLEADRPAVLARSRMNMLPGWSATLTVTPGGGEPYSLTVSETQQQDGGEHMSAEVDAVSPRAVRGFFLATVLGLLLWGMTGMAVLTAV